MDSRLLRLVRDYQAKVVEAVAMLATAGISRPQSDLAWVKRHAPGNGMLPGGFVFCVRGFGCTVDGPEWGVDFDFGAVGEIDGFDASRLFDFARKRRVDYGFGSEEDIETAIRRAAESGDLRFSGNILYYLTGPPPVDGTEVDEPPRRIRIVRTPDGDAPRAVRRAWVGLTLTLASGESGARRLKTCGLLADWRGWLGVIRRFLVGSFRVGYVVESAAALEVLRRSSPEAYAWWRENTPHLFNPDRTFVFPADGCRVVEPQPEAREPMPSRSV